MEAIESGDKIASPYWSRFPTGIKKHQCRDDLTRTKYRKNSTRIMLFPDRGHRRQLSRFPVKLSDSLICLFSFLDVDGKWLKGGSNNEHISHLVELFAAQSRIVIRQEWVPNKSCERKALSQLLGSIDVRGAIISFDAHFTYKGDLQYVRDQGADYLVGIIWVYFVD